MVSPQRFDSSSKSSRIPFIHRASKIMTKITTYTIPDYFLPILINDDFNRLDLTQEDRSKFKEFIEREELDESMGHWSLPENSEPYFGSNDVTDIKGNVIDIEFVDMTPDVILDPPNTRTLSFDEFSKEFNCKSSKVLDILDAKALDTGEIHFLRMNEGKKTITFQEYDD